MAAVVTVNKFIPTKGFVTSRRVRYGTNSALFVHALVPAAAANGYNAVAGSEAGFRDGSSAFNMSCLDTNATALNVGFCQASDTTGAASTTTFFSVPAATSFRMVFDVNYWTNRSTTVLGASKAQVGLMAIAAADFSTDISTIPQKAANSAIYVEFCQNKMRLFVGTTASAYVAIPTTLLEFSVRVEYIAGVGAFLYLNNSKVATVQSTTATTALQVFARAGHTTDYATATDSPIRFELDSVSVAIDKT